MKFSATAWAFAAATFVSMASPAAAVPLCALNCFNSVMTEFPPLTCTEANMFLCFCKSTLLAVAYYDCACKECATPALSADAIKFGLDTCVEYEAPIHWLPSTCAA